MTPTQDSYVDASVPIQAPLGLPPAGYHAPIELEMIATPDAGTVEKVWLSADGGTLYFGNWFPALEGSYLLQVFWPDSGVSSAQIFVTVDKTSPDLKVTIPQPPTASGIYFQPDSGGSGWRRDQTVPVIVSSNDPRVQLSTVRLLVSGIVDGGVAAPMAFNAVAGSCDASFCAVASIDLAAEPMDAFQGTFALTATARDEAGNLAATDGGVLVTRFKWELDSLVLSDSELSIGHSGTLYATEFGQSAGVAAISPEGVPLWTWVTDGGVFAKYMVGTDSAGADRIYIAWEDSARTYTVLQAIDAAGHPLPPTCLTERPGARQSLVSALARSNPPGTIGFVETALVSGSAQILALSPDATLSDVCEFVGPSPSAFAVNDTTVVVLTDGGAQAFDLGLADQLTPLWSVAGDPSIHGFAGPADQALIDDQGSILTTIGTFNTEPLGIAALRTGLSNPSWQSFSTGSGPLLALSSNLVLVGGCPSGLCQLQQFDLSSGALSSNRFVLPNQNPANPPFGWTDGLVTYGSDGTTYFHVPPGQLFALDGTLTPHWSLATQLSDSRGQVVLDCTRDAGVPVAGRPGVLYVPFETVLVAIVVDSRGIDTNAPWPLADHDPRRTNNPATDLSQFACP